MEGQIGRKKDARKTIFLDEMIRAGAKRSEIKALVDGISYAHRRVWLADPTTDPIVKAVIQRKEKN